MADGWARDADDVGEEHGPGTLSGSADLERFRARIAAAIAGADGRGRSGAVVYVGLDGFRAVPPTMCHAVCFLRGILPPEVGYTR